MNCLADSRRDWFAVRDHVASGYEGMGPGLVRQTRENYERDLLARIEELMDARGGTPEGAELKALADEWVAHERDSDGTASAALCEDIAVPQDCQARPSPNPSHRPIRRENNG